MDEDGRIICGGVTSSGSSEKSVCLLPVDHSRVVDT